MLVLFRPPIRKYQNFRKCLKIRNYTPLLEQHKPCNVFNADELGLFYNLLPNKTYAFKGESCHGGRMSKDRMKVLTGANMDGSEKLLLLVIRKSGKPRCFRDVKNLPCK
jgi:hypothetical protein